jgi:hypothetical protein
LRSAAEGRKETRKETVLEFLLPKKDEGGIIIGRRWLSPNAQDRPAAAAKGRKETKKETVLEFPPPKR